MKPEDNFEGGETHRYLADDEIIEVKLPRREYKILRNVLERERTYTNITGFLKSFWIWAVAGGLLSVFALWDTIKGVLK